MNRRTDFLETAEAVLEKDADRLRELIGSKLTDVWLAWDTRHDEWFTDEAIVFRFGQRQLEASHMQISQMLITWDTVDLKQPPNWLGCYEDLPLVWQKNKHAAARSVVGGSLENIAIVEYLNQEQGPVGLSHLYGKELLYAIEFKFDRGSLVLYNALDENGMQNEPLSGSEIRKHWIASSVEE